MEEENKVEVAKVFEEEKSGGGFAIASLVCSLVGIIMGTIAIVFVVIGLATAGLIICIIDVAIVSIAAMLY